jgi:hypothetical protein
MVKTIISAICVAVILIVGPICEMNYIRNEFNEFHTVISELYEKVDENVAGEDDVYAVQKNWLEKKRSLHAFIPHNEIKEVDLWLAESATLVRDKKWEDAISKIEVLKELAEQIPKTFSLSLANIL